MLAITEFKESSFRDSNCDYSAQMLRGCAKQRELKSEMLAFEYLGCGTKIDSNSDSGTLETCQNSCFPEMWAKITRDPLIFSKAPYTAFNTLNTHLFRYFNRLQIETKR